MATNCTAGLTANIEYDCDNEVTGGLEVDMLFFNRNEIKKDAVTFDPLKPILMTNFAMQVGKKGFLISGIKQINSTSMELVKKEKSSDKFKHKFMGIIPGLSVENKMRLIELSRGANLCVMFEMRWKGVAQKEAFQLLGYDNGLELSVANWNSGENDGNITFEMESVASYEESKPPITVLETDYAATKLAFTNKFLGV